MSSNSLGKTTIETRPDDVAPFTSHAQQRADAERDALGFIPKGAYQDAALQGKLWIATKSIAQNETYVGHLLFGGVFPTLRIFQLFVEPGERRSGTGSALIEALVKDAESRSYVSIVARVADDLEANSFWEGMDFHVVRAERGGSTRNRVILLRERRLNTPTLFDLLHASSTPTDHDLRLAERVFARSPAFAIDINVLLDIAKSRPRAEDVRKIIAAAMANSIRLFIAPEFVKELKNATQDGVSDPVLEFAISLPQFPLPPDGNLKRLCLELAPLIFPERTRQNRLKPRDESDLAHIATAIHHGSAGFITSEKAILRSKQILRERFDLDVIGTSELAEALTPAQWVEHDRVTSRIAADEGEIAIAEVTEEDRPKAQKFLESLGISGDQVTDALASGHAGCLRRRLLISEGKQVVAFASWDAPQKVNARVDALIFTSVAASRSESALDQILLLLIADVSHHGATVLRLSTAPPSSIFERAVGAIGFRPARVGGQPVTGVFEKACLGRIGTASNWTAVRTQLYQVARITLPVEPPTYEGPRTALTVTSPQGASLWLPLEEVEELLAPALLIVPGRPGAIVPIRRAYAEQLLDSSRQNQLFPKYEASLLFRRAYFSASRTLGLLEPGTILFFYESQKQSGSGAVVACARAIENAVRPPQDISASIKRRGVLEDAPIQEIGHRGKTTVTFFDTVMKFRRPVILSRLRAIGCCDGANFVTAKRISYEHVVKLLTEGQPHV